MGLFRKKASETSGDSSYENILGRYYSFEDMQPVFCGNSGVTLSPLGPAQLLDEHYPTNKVQIPTNKLRNASKFNCYTYNLWTGNEVSVS